MYTLTQDQVDGMRATMREYKRELARADMVRRNAEPDSKSAYAMAEIVAHYAGEIAKVQWWLENAR